MAFTFIEEGAPQETASRFRFVDEEPVEIPALPAKPKGTLESAADVFTGAGARVAQGVNESLGAINNSFGFDSTVYKEGADYWKNTAEEAGSTGLPAQIYQGVGAAPAGVAEFIAGPVYAGAKGAVQGYREGGVTGALEKATVETVKRYGLGKIFHGIENTSIGGLPKAGAMGSTMGAQTAAEQAMTDEGLQPQDVAASAITGTLLSVNGGGRSETVRQNLIKEGVQPEIARDLAGRAEEGAADTSGNPSRFRFVDEVAPKEPTEAELATAYNDSIWRAGKSGLMQGPGTSNALFQERLLMQYRRALEKETDATSVMLPTQEEPTQAPITITGPQGEPLDIPVDTRSPESIGPLVSETGNGSVLSLGETTTPARLRFVDQAATDQPANIPNGDIPNAAFDQNQAQVKATGPADVMPPQQKEPPRPPVSITDAQGNPIDVPLDTRPSESIGPLVSETGNGSVYSTGETTTPARFRFVDQAATDQPANIPNGDIPNAPFDQNQAPAAEGINPVQNNPVLQTKAESDVTKPGAVEQFTATTKRRGNQEIFDVKLNPSQRRTLETVRQEISDGEAGQRVGIDNANEPGVTNLSWGSTFPDYFQKKGYTKRQALGAIDNILSGEGVTANQRIMVEDMHQAKRQQDINVILNERAKPSEVSAMNLNAGDTLKRNGEQFKVLDVSPDGVTIKDGVTMELSHEQAINYDRGTLKSPDGKLKRIAAENVSNPSTEDYGPYNNTLYRGTAERDPLHSGGMGQGVYYTSDAGIAKSYAEDFSDVPGQVTSQEVSLSKPFYAKTLDDVYSLLPEAERNALHVREGESINEAGIRQQKQIVNILTSRGHDGIVLRNSLNPRTGEYVGADEVVVFPKEIMEKQSSENPSDPFTKFSVSETPATETARQGAAETLNSVYPENSPNIGLAVKPGIKRDDTMTMPGPHTDKAGNFTFTDPQVERRWKEANGLSDGPSFLYRTKAFMHKMLSETQHFPEMDTTNFAGKRTADILRRFESSAVAAKAKTAEHLHGLTATFGPKKMDIFTRKVILDDLMNEADKGRGLPFGYTPEALQKDHAAVSKIVDTHTDIKAAVNRRADVNKALVMDLVENDLLPVESVLKPEALPHFQKTGKYSSDDINTHYFRHQVLEYANARRWTGVSTAGDVRNKHRGWQKGRQGSELDINTNFLEAEFEVFSQGLKELATKKTLDEVLTLNDLVPELKAQAKKEGAADWKDLIPEGHVIWQPEKGSMFYRGQTMPEQIVNKFISENPHFVDIAKKFREVTILGGKKTEVVIPSGLAKTLDSLRTDRESATLDTVNQKMLGAWKIWTLLSPRRAIKYNLNNMSGDLDAAIAADPGIVIKHFNTAWKNAWNRRAGRAMTKDEIDMLDRGVIDAGISINEIPDINKLPGFSRLSEADRQQKLIAALRSGDLSKLAPPNVIAKYFHWVSGLSQLREGLLREAAYLRAKELLEQGKKVYWASKPAEIESLPDIKDKAAKLSRELLGDYGNLSAHGEKIRARFIPFWSWMEINTPRYYRLFQNAAAKGEGGSTAARMAGAGTRKIAGASLGIAEKVLLTQVLFASVTAFNHLVHPDEEDLLGEADQKQLHVILGTKADGKIMTARFQGAFSDALSWFGLEDYPKQLRDFKDGKMEPGELAKKMLLATPNKIANSAAPFFKLGGELITGKSIYPDITKPFQIRDKTEHAARFLSLDNEYKAMTGKPTRGYLDSLKGLYLYENDPGEIAYQNTRRLAAKYLEKNGKESVSGEPTKRSNALYYYKQALRYDDEAAADKYKEEYFAEGGTKEGIQKSIAKAHPMWMLPLNQRAKFRQSLSAQELETLTKGIDWYRQVYAP